MQENMNIYRRARIRATAHDRVFASRDRAALLLYVSKEALYDYEHERTPTVPGCDIVQRMVEVYGDPDLLGEHIRAHCPLLPDYGACGSHLAEAACGWSLAFHQARDIVARFLAVARDGRIDARELEDAAAVRAAAVEIRRVMEESITAIDKALQAYARGGGLA